MAPGNRSWHTCESPSGYCAFAHIRSSNYQSILQQDSPYGLEICMGASFKDLIVWQRAIELSLAVYELTSTFPASEQFGLSNQLRRASVSVASNIAEGYGKTTKGQYLQFLGHARGSNFEVQTQLVISEALRYGTRESCRKAKDLSQEVSRMLVALMAKLEKVTD